MDPLTHNLNQMIDHQRRAERCQGDEQDYHFRQAMRYRAMAYKLQKQGRVLQGFIDSWLNLN
jgi:hypothetical protein